MLEFTLFDVFISDTVDEYKIYYVFSNKKFNALAFESKFVLFCAAQVQTADLRLASPALGACVPGPSVYF